MKQFVLDRLKERSTWIGLIGIITTFGLLQLAPDQKEAVIYLAVVLFGGAAAMPEKK